MREYKRAWAAAHPEYARSYYLANREKVIARARERHSRLRTAINVLLNERKEGGCVDCGYDNPVALDFDHRDPFAKKFCLSNRVAFQASPEELIAEIDKCDVRCANCHRIRTHNERHWLMRGKK